jgi:hypothetical protein
MKNRKVFTIGGSIALKKALLEETGLKPYDKDTSIEWDYLEVLSQYEGFMLGTSNIAPIHYQLPQDWHQAVQAVKEFFAEEKFEKGKWYCYSNGGTLELYKFNVLTEVASQDYWCYSERVTGNYVHEYSDEGDGIMDVDIINSLEIARHEQVKEVLGNTAKLKGFIKSALINQSTINSAYPTCSKIYSNDIDYDYEKDILYYGGFIVYEGGMWVDLLPQDEIKDMLDNY